MNIYYSDILKHLTNKKFTNQRDLAIRSGYSLGEVNIAISFLRLEGLINNKCELTKKGQELIEKSKTKRAVILAAGFGKRMVPINLETPKGLLQVNGEILIERIIEQLQEAGIKEIYIVVGFMKESFEYLIDKYQVKLIVNTQYTTKNNYYSLLLAAKYIDNAYIIPSDVYFKKNPFSSFELYSWYMVKNTLDARSIVIRNIRNQLVRTMNFIHGNTMVGLAYIQTEFVDYIRNNLKQFDENPRDNDTFWEKALFNKDKFVVAAKLIKNDDVVCINTYEQLRDLDSSSSHLKNNAIETICEALKVNENEVGEIKVLKKGMTNRSFLFSCKGKEYIMRIPGEGTDQLINRAQEAEVYKAIKDKNICDNIVYINPENGYKITEFFQGAKVVNPSNDRDVKKAMTYLRNFHNLKLKVSHEFDIFKQIEFYESLRGNTPSLYRDYQQTKEMVYELKRFIDKNKKSYCLTHIDAVPDNFLFVRDKLKEEIKLIDWEYSGMQDSDVDIAMFCIYSLYERKQVEKTIKAYYPEGVDKTTRLKIYCYIAVCGFLWSNWCEFKRTLGVEFGEYGLRQYRYAKEYYRIFKEESEND